MKITNTGNGVRVINIKDGERVRSVAINPGQTVDVTPVETAVYKAAVKNGKLKTGGSASSTKENGGTYVTRHKGGGTYVVVDVLGNEVMEGLTKADAESFAALSEKEKAEMVEASRK